MPLYSGKSADGSDMVEHRGVFTNPDNDMEWSSTPYSGKQQRHFNLREEYNDYTNGRFSLQMVYEQIIKKVCPLSKRVRDWVLSHYDKQGNFKQTIVEEQFITFEGKELLVVWGAYASNNVNRLQLMLYSEEMGTYEPFLTASSNVEHVELEEDEIIIKDYGENEGILPILIKEGIIAKPHETIKSGVADLYICQLIN